MMSYCVKCKKNTDTLNLSYSVTKNKRPLLKGVCKLCGKNKTRFISAEDAKKGGFIFTLPLALAALGAAGSLAGGASQIATAVNKKKAADKLLAETKRHNKAMEGAGLFLKPYKKK